MQGSGARGGKGQLVSRKWGCLRSLWHDGCSWVRRVVTSGEGRQDDNVRFSWGRNMTCIQAYWEVQARTSVTKRSPRVLGTG